MEQKGLPIDLKPEDELAASFSFGIVCTQWNSDITDSLKKASQQTLLEHGAATDCITILDVPGAFELTFGVQALLEKQHMLPGIRLGNSYYDAIIAIGCVVQGDTPHFDYICKGLTYGLVGASLQYKTPVIYGVLTVLNMEQATQRSTGKQNKGIEFAHTAIKMAQLKRKAGSHGQVGI